MRCRAAPAALVSDITVSVQIQVDKDSLQCRGYLERAINAHGGFGAVAALIGWEMAYIPKRPRGYWDSVEHIRSEVDEFTQAHGLSPGTIPQLRDVRAADRYTVHLPAFTALYSRHWKHACHVPIGKFTSAVVRLVASAKCI